ncbi:MAG: ABC transporter substrate-binding protein [Alistipes sp.]|nr:ABC transporter substrate-binding protein [Alistipes sp.]
MGAMLTSCNEQPREETLKVYNWGDYIDEDLLDEFEVWYEEQTGTPVNIVYQTFDINEVMLAKIEKGEADFDVVCPSEYIIERMMRHDILVPIVTDEFLQDLENTGTENYLSSVSPYIINQFDHIIAPDGHNPNDYSVGYMWGTTGILYNTEYITEEEALSWDLMFDERLEGKILVKDAFRDVYSPILVYARTLEAREAGIIGATERLPLNDSEALERGLEGKVATIDGLMYDASDESIKHVEEYLKRMKRLVAGWEADFGKEMMTQEKAWINLMWSGDAVWAIEEAADVDVELDYAVPEEGSVVWFDGWVIPKYAQNKRAARYFINYMCKPENAVRNMDATGYVSVVGTKEVLIYMDEMLAGIDEVLSKMEKCKDEKQYAELEATLQHLTTERDTLLTEEGINLGYFFKDEEGNPLVFNMADEYNVDSEYANYVVDATCVYVDPILYPDRSVIDRCSMMHDSGEQTDKMLEMWSRVKGDNLSPTMLIFIIVSFGVLLFFVILGKVNAYRKKQKMLKRRRHSKSKQQQQPR